MLVELKFGEGGEDSKLFVSELATAYLRYASALGFAAELLHSEHGHVIIKVRGKDVFRAFEHETGQHCCQRVPVTERHGRKQTSMISVAVLPIREEATYKPLPVEELEITAQRGSQTAGGQKVNKCSSAIRAKHLPTGIVVFIQNERSQSQNKAEAIRILTARVNDQRRAAADSAYAAHRREKLGDGRRGSKARTYNFMESRVVDHRLGKKTTRIDQIMRGNFQLLFR